MKQSEDAKTDETDKMTANITNMKNIRISFPFLFFMVRNKSAYSM